MRSLQSGKFRRLWVLAMVCCGAAMTGCGGGAGDSPPMFKVSGQISFGGEPIQEGRILMRKTSGDGKAFSSLIKDGSYSVMTEEGAMSVEITASRIIPGKFDNSNGTPEPVGEMYIPKQYNTETTLEVTVPKGGKSDADFALAS